MQIIAFRHGIAMEHDDAKAAGLSDAERELTKDGEEKTRDAVKGLRELVKGVDLIVHSPLLRAVQTADILEAAYKGVDRVETKALLPGTPPDKLSSFLLQRIVKKKLDTAIIVGHEPDLSKWVGWCMTGRGSPLFALKKAGACCVEFDGGPRPGKGVLQWLLEAGQLRKLGKL